MFFTSELLQDVCLVTIQSLLSAIVDDGCATCKHQGSQSVFDAERISIAWVELPRWDLHFSMPPTRFLAVVCDSGKPGLIKFHNPRTSFKLTLDFWATYILTSLALLHMWRCMPMLACSLGLQTERRYFLPSCSSWLSTKLPNKSKFEYNLGCELWVLFSVPRSSRLNNLWQQKTYKSTSKFFRGSTFTPLPSYPEDSWMKVVKDNVCISKYINIYVILKIQQVLTCSLKIGKRRNLLSNHDFHPRIRVKVLDPPKDLNKNPRAATGNKN